jgi:hypothetical protein
VQKIDPFTRNSSWRMKIADMFLKGFFEGRPIDTGGFPVFPVARFYPCAAFRSSRLYNFYLQYLKPDILMAT